mmetsp:Transcript_6293/g.14328  ORF Transcript_6293/g.14328 Transcript_6293/m.14328 type:complete len:238 (+) Transcript_6293:694-1407(+)
MSLASLPSKLRLFHSVAMWPRTSDRTVAITKVKNGSFGSGVTRRESSCWNHLMSKAHNERMPSHESTRLYFPYSSRNNRMRLRCDDLRRSGGASHTNKSIPSLTNGHTPLSPTMKTARSHAPPRKLSRDSVNTEKENAGPIVVVSDPAWKSMLMTFPKPKSEYKNKTMVDTSMKGYATERPSGTSALAAKQALPFASSPGSAKQPSSSSRFCTYTAAAKPSTARNNAVIKSERLTMP